MDIDPSKSVAECDDSPFQEESKRTETSGSEFVIVQKEEIGRTVLIQDHMDGSMGARKKPDLK